MPGTLSELFVTACCNLLLFCMYCHIKVQLARLFFGMHDTIFVTPRVFIQSHDFTYTCTK